MRIKLSVQPARTSLHVYLQVVINVPRDGWYRALYV